MTRVRFDDLTPGAEHAFELEGLQDVVVAADPGQVGMALQAVEAANRRGLWAGGFVAYEAASGFDPALKTCSAQSSLPVLWFGLYRRRTPAAPLLPRAPQPAPYHISAWRTKLDRADHAAAVQSIREHIAAGDTYQVNYTFLLRAAFSGEPFELYRDLVLAQRGAFGAYLDTGRHVIASASPEMFYTREGSRIEVRPMKGTIGRGRFAAEDRELARRLTGSVKDRAENLMIVDLLRNDLGRIAEFGSVRVDELFALERYETVWQLTSKISAEVAPDVGLAETFAALFPSGSVTGAPKASTMQIIHELEGAPRGVYCGAVGYAAPHTGAEPPLAAFNVAIRTVDIDTAEGAAVYGVGGGITWDSMSDAEYAEARVKAQLLVERRPDFSLVETLRWEPHHGYRWRNEHVERLTDSADFFGFPLDLDLVAEALDKAVDGAEGGQRVRLLLRRNGTVDVSAVAHPVEFRPEPNDDGDPVRFVVDTVPVNPQNVFLFHKTTHRSAYDSRLKRHPYADDVLMVNDRGTITEFTIGNVCVQIDGRWCTPPVDCGLLGGVARRAMLEAGVLVERPIRLEDLVAARRVAFLNSVKGWRPAKRIGVEAARSD